MRQMIGRGKASRLTALIVLAALAGCTVQGVVPPSFIGPSELGLSLLLRAIPDVITQDGLSQALIVIEARDDNAQPVRNLQLHVEIFYQGQRFDYGGLSTRFPVTGSTGRTELTYTAPPPDEPLDVDVGRVVTIFVTPVGNNYANANARSLDIRLVPRGVILPGNVPPVAAFTFSQPAEEGTPVTFDASTSTDSDGQIVSYSWVFGDGTTGSGVTVRKTYTRSGTYNVTLTVTDDRGQQRSVTQSVTVGGTTAPTALIDYSPTTPGPGDKVFFTAARSTAATGRQIVSYQWQFGDGRSATGVTVDHRYDLAGTYTVTLVVTDDVGKQGSTTASVAVGQAAPTASISFSPSEPAVRQRVFFTGEASRAAAGRQIVRYRWQFGDGASASGVRVDHRYDLVGIYIVTLTVTDDVGNQGTATATVTVEEAAGGLFASFTFSPEDPAPGETVFFDGSDSTSPRTITSYAWDFGDGTRVTRTSPRVSHSFDSAATYVVRLTITDASGRTATTTRSVEVE